MIGLGIFLIATYVVIMLVLGFGFCKQEYFTSEDSQPVTKFSIVIPFRNEADNLNRLLISLQKLNYPTNLFEILCINDASEDASEEIIQRYINEIDNQGPTVTLIQNIRTSNSPKKDAISLGIERATYSWIVTTDADCEVPISWLRTIDAYIQKNEVQMIAAPVAIQAKRRLLRFFQELDMMSLQFVTVASFGLERPLLCNGANLAYTKQLFATVNGFQDNDHIASGDDIFMLEKARNKAPEQVHYLKSIKATVLTKAQPSWSAVIGQRVRWASKTSKQNNLQAQLLGALVLLLNLWILVGFLLVPFYSGLWIAHPILLTLKFLIDYSSLRLTAAFFRTNIRLGSFFICGLIYPILIVQVVCKSMIGGYRWKGRNYPNAG